MCLSVLVSVNTPLRYVEVTFMHLYNTVLRLTYFIKMYTYWKQHVHVQYAFI